MRFDDWQPPQIEDGKLTKWNWMVQHPENLQMSDQVDIGAFTYINALAGVELAAGVQIGSHCSIYSASSIDNKHGQIRIGENSCIGTHSTIMPGITIGENSIIGAHSFVNRDIPANVTAVGVPAKILNKKEKSGDSEIERSKLMVGSKTSATSINQNQNLIPLSQPAIDEEDIAQVVEVLKTGRLSLGPKLKEFEQKFAQMIGTRYGVGVNSGTSGLHLCIRALGLKKDDEVITSSFSFIASANCLLYEQVTPIFVDVEADTCNLDPTQIESAITTKTKAILIPHIFGQSGNMHQIMELAKKHNLKVIEDACESINSTHHDQKVGTFGDVAVFAFYPNKQMTTGEGGMIVTNNKEIYQYCKSASNQGRSDDEQWLTHDRLGYNYRLDELSAALGLSQLNKLDLIIKKRQELANYYMQELADCPEIGLPQIKPENNCTWFVFPIRVKSKIRDGLLKKLNDAGIQSKAYFCPCIHLQPLYKRLFGYQEGLFPVAEKLAQETIALPFYTEMDKGTVNQVCEQLKNILGAEVNK